MTEGILINYEYCTGCHSCEVACKKRLGLPEGEFGIKLTETGPWEYAGEPKGEGRWEWTWLPVLTKACDLCADRTEKGKMPMCVQHCQAWCLYHGEVGELARKMDGKTRWALMGAAGEVAVRAAVAPDRARRPRGRARAAGARLRGREACESTRGSETAAGVRRWHDRGRACDGGWRASGSARAAGARTAALVWHAGVAETANARRHP